MRVNFIRSAPFPGGGTVAGGFAMSRATTLAGGALAGVLIGAGGIGSVVTGQLLQEGIAINPHLAVIFRGIGFREHGFQYKFVARNQSESDTLKKAEQLCIDLNSIILDKTPKSFIAQYLGTRREVDSFIKKIKPLGAISISRSGALAMKKGPETVKDNKGKVL